MVVFRMMKMHYLFLIVITSFLSNSAMAGEPVKESQSWYGYYMGVSYGTVNVNDEYEEWNNEDSAVSNYTYVLADDSSAESLFFGYNSDYLGSNILLGAEFSVELRDLDKTVYDLLSGSISTAFDTSYKSDWSMSLTPRIGYFWTPNLLLYASLGYTLTDTERVYIITASNISDVSKQNIKGWTSGLGVEYGLSKNLNMRIDYKKTNYEDYAHVATIYGGNIQKTRNYQDSGVRLSFVYRF